jgi:hypothetical protein
MGFFPVSVGNPDSGTEFIPNNDLFPEKMSYLGHTKALLNIKFKYENVKIFKKGYDSGSRKQTAYD